MLVSPDDSETLTEREFSSKLRQLVARADAEGVDVRGAWDVDPDTDDSAEFEILITEVDR